MTIPGRYTITTLISVALIGIFAVAAFLYSRPAPAEPTITWIPPSLTQAMPAGQSATISASFTVSKDVSGLTVRVVPELEPFVTVEPSSFDNIAKGVTTTVKIMFVSSIMDESGTYDGTIQLRQDRKNVAKPLPIALTISPSNPITIVDGSDIGPNLIGAETTDGFGNIITTYMHEAFDFEQLHIVSGLNLLPPSSQLSYVTDGFIEITYPPEFGDQRTTITIQHESFNDRIKVIGFDEAARLLTFFPYNNSEPGVVKIKTNVHLGKVLFAVIRENHEN